MTTTIPTEGPKATRMTSWERGLVRRLANSALLLAIVHEDPSIASHVIGVAAARDIVRLKLELGLLSKAEAEPWLRRPQTARVIDFASARARIEAQRSRGRL